MIYNLLFRSSIGILDDDDMILNACCKTLRLMKLRSTGVRVPGLRILFNNAKYLEGVRCNSNDVLRALVLHLKLLQKFESFSTLDDTNIYRMSLKYLDFSNCFAILNKFLYLLPKLVEVRIGADAPPKVRRANEKLRQDDIIVNNNLSEDRDQASEAALFQLPKLHKLRYIFAIRLN